MVSSRASTIATCGLHPTTRLPCRGTANVSHLYPERVSSEQVHQHFGRHPATTCASLPAYSDSTTVAPALAPSCYCTQLVYGTHFRPTIHYLVWCLHDWAQNISIYSCLLLCHCTSHDLVQVDAPLRPSDRLPMVHQVVLKAKPAARPSRKL